MLFNWNMRAWTEQNSKETHLFFYYFLKHVSFWHRFLIWPSRGEFGYKGMIVVFPNSNLFVHPMRREPKCETPVLRQIKLCHQKGSPRREEKGSFPKPPCPVLLSLVTAYMCLGKRWICDPRRGRDFLKTWGGVPWNDLEICFLSDNERLFGNCWSSTQIISVQMLVSGPH